MLFYTCNLKKLLLKCPFSECRETPLEVQGVTVLNYPVMLRLYALVIQDKLIEAWFSAIVSGPGQSWLFPADFWPILGYFGLFKTKS